MVRKFLNNEIERKSLRLPAWSLVRKYVFLVRYIFHHRGIEAFVHAEVIHSFNVFCGRNYRIYRISIWKSPMKYGVGVSEAELAACPECALILKVCWVRVRPKF